MFDPLVKYFCLVMLVIFIADTHYPHGCFLIIINYNVIERCREYLAYPLRGPILDHSVWLSHYYHYYYALSPLIVDQRRYMNVILLNIAM